MNFALAPQMAYADMHIRTMENRIGVDCPNITTTLLYWPEYSGSITTTAEIKYDVSDINFGVSITNAVMTQRLTPDSKQRLTLQEDPRLTVERSKQLNSSPTFAQTYNYLPGYVGWSK